MKKVFYIPLLLALLISCKKTDVPTPTAGPSSPAMPTPIPTVTSVTWQLTGYAGGIGAIRTVVPASDSAFLILYSDSTYERTAKGAIDKGVYHIVTVTNYLNGGIQSPAIVFVSNTPPPPAAPVPGTAIYGSTFNLLLTPRLLVYPGPGLMEIDDNFADGFGYSYIKISL